MRPLRVTITAFGPYKGKEVIDFEQLNEANLFVISGNTGAGKTTIFDAICFALYGSASGEDRGSTVMLRSHFAEDDVHTSVEFVFSLHQRTYRVLRQLGHVKKGNSTPTGERYEFFEMSEEGEIPVVDRQLVSEINDKIEQMIGLTQEQFKQIVMLPQGEFRKLLTSNTENKERILRKIFKTERYNSLNDRLREKRDSIQKLYDQQVTKRDQYIQQIGSIFPRREDVALFTDIEAEEKNMYKIENGLTAEIDYYAEKMIEDTKVQKDAYNRLQDKQKAYAAAESINTLFKEQEEKEKRAEVLKEQIPLIDEKEKNLKLADRASRIVVYEKHAADFLTDEKKHEQQLKDIKEAHKTAVHQKEKDTETFEAEEKRAPERERLKKNIDMFNMYVPDVREMKENSKNLHDIAKQVEHTKTLVQTITKDVETNEKLIENMRKDISHMEEQTSTLVEKVELLHTMREQVTPFKQYLQNEKELRNIHKQVRAEEAAYQEVKGRYDALENEWIHSQASILATHLQDGEACPVCGSMEHPDKNTRSNQAVSREDLAKVRKELDDKHAMYRTTIGTEQGITKKLDENFVEVSNIHPIERHEVNSYYTKLVDKGKRLSEEVTSLTKTKEKLDQKRKDLEKLMQSARSSIEKRDEAKKEYDQKREEYNKIHTIYERQQEKVPKEIQNLDELMKRIKESTDTLEKLEKAREKAQQALEQTKTQLTQVTAQKESAEKGLQEAANRREQAEKEFQEALRKGDFTSEEEYKQAQLDEERQTQLKKEIEAVHQERNLLSERLMQLQKELTDKQYTPLADLQADIDQLQKTYEEAWKVMHASQEYVERGEEIQKNMLDVQQEVEKFEKKRALTADVFDVIRGQNGPRISFERYIQMDYLEQIIEAANERFHILSNGQYTLLRSERQETHGRQSGLALDVHDAYTGQQRDVKSLSGGEKFNASLSLALGMSDVVQSFQGNVSVETMFIDEGFGTLDEEALQNAIDTLIDLQRSGRMIGVISHVEQLKELFPAVLEVTKTKEGFSETTFMIK